MQKYYRMIYLIITTSINNKFGLGYKYGSQNNEYRKQRYLDSIGAALSFTKDEPRIKPIIVENNGDRITYLDEFIKQTGFECDIVYTNNNNYVFPHKGVNELLDIKQVIDQYNITNEDTIIKLTGRYKLLDPSFFNRVLEHSNAYEAFVKFFNVCKKEYMQNDCVLGLVSTKCKYLKEFMYMGKQSAECEFATFIRQRIEKERIFEITDLQLECCFADSLEILVV